RGPGVRAPLPTRRPRRGQGRGPGEWAAPCRPRARDPRSHEAADDPDRRQLGQGDRRQEGGVTDSPQSERWSAPIFGALSFSQSMIPKKPAPHLMRGGYRFSEKIKLQDHSSVVTGGIAAGGAAVAGGATGAGAAAVGAGSGSGAGLASGGAAGTGVTAAGFAAGFGRGIGGGAGGKGAVTPAGRR